MLDNWSLNITPVIIRQPPDRAATTFTIGFPVQQLSGTYTMQLGPNILDTFNEGARHQPERGLGRAAGPGSEQPDNHSPLHRRASCPRRFRLPSRALSELCQSTITVPDSFIVQGDTTRPGLSGMQVQISLTYPNDPDLTATLYHTT